MKNTRERSLEVRKKAKEALNKILRKDNWKFIEYYNDLYGRKNGYEVRRLKGVISYDNHQLWARKEMWVKWKEEFEEIDFGSEFKVELHPVDKLKSIGGLKEKEERKLSWVNYNKGSVEEYEDRFNNEDFLFTVRIIYKDELNVYCTTSGLRKSSYKYKKLCE
jgi:hypothetical protein